VLHAQQVVAGGQQQAAGQQRQVPQVRGWHVVQIPENSCLQGPQLHLGGRGKSGVSVERVGVERVGSGAAAASTATAAGGCLGQRDPWADRSSSTGASTLSLAPCLGTQRRASAGLLHPAAEH